MRTRSLVARFSRFRLRARAGFSMMELMVAVAISVIVVAGLYAMFTLQSRQFIYQDQQMHMHQNLRFGTDILSRSVRMAGYGTGGSTVGVFGYNASGVSSADSLPAVISHDNWGSSAVEHDAISVVYGDPSLEMMTTLQIQSAGATSISFPMGRRNYQNLITNYSAGDLLMCWDYAAANGTRSFLWEISSGGNASTGSIGVLPNSGVYADYDAVIDSSSNLPPIMHCSRGHVATFYIDDTDDSVGPGSPEHPVLMMDLDYDFPGSGPSGDDVPLVDDIEDLQLAYCGPTTATANPDCTLEGNYTDNLTTVAEMSSVWAVRISLVARSKTFDKRLVHEEVPPTLENHSPSTADHYHRQVLTTTVSSRNLRLLYSAPSGS